MKNNNKRALYTKFLATGLILLIFSILAFTNIGAELTPAVVDRVIWDDNPVNVNFVRLGTYYIFVKRIYTTESHRDDKDLFWSVSIYSWDEKIGGYIETLRTDYIHFEMNRFYVWGFTIAKPGVYKVAIYNNMRCYCQTSKFHIIIKPGLLT